MNSEPRTRVKICGITNLEDALAAIELGADALGFNTCIGSKRYIDLAKEAGWIASLPPFVTKVVVMANRSVEEAEAVFKQPFVDAVQFHGAEDADFCAHFAKTGSPFIKAIALRDATLLEDVAQFHTPHILLDAYSAHAFGGTGQLIDLELAAKFAATHSSSSVILSGGLNPANVAEAIRRVRPYAVDVASGVERESRWKDHQLIGEFIRAASRA